MSGFEGFPKEGLQFLKGLEKNNKKAWFEANREKYERGLLEPAKEFVLGLGKRLQKIAPDIRADPRINRSIRRMNRDVRFSNDKNPYKTFLDIEFWDGEDQRCGTSKFFLRIEGDKLHLGSGMYMFNKPMLARYRDAVVEEKKGSALSRAIAKVKKAGHDVGGTHYKKTPKGYPKDHKRGDLLLHGGLFSIRDYGLPKDIHGEEFIEFCYAEFKDMKPLQKWLRELSDD